MLAKQNTISDTLNSCESLALLKEPAAHNAEIVALLK
jgi:hypothetical protein